MRININPIYNPTSHKVIVYPIAPGEMWLVTLSQPPVITSIVTHTVLAEKEDDQGLHYRVDKLFTDDFIAYCLSLGIAYVMVSCANYQEEAPDCSNKLYIYDTFMPDGKVVNLHMTEKCCRLSGAHRPPYVVTSLRKALDFYLDKPDILFWGRSRFPRPVVVRNFDTDEPDYKLLDPYLQWSPPRFWHQAEMMANIPNNLEGWLAEVVKSFNWDYFYHLIHNEGHPMADKDHLIAALFDILYDEYLYYGICKKIFVDNTKQVTQYPQLMGMREEQVLVNFTDIVNSIREIVLSHLTDYVPKDLLVEEVIDIDMDQKRQNFNNMFDKME